MGGGEVRERGKIWMVGIAGESCSYNIISVKRVMKHDFWDRET